MGGCLLLDLLAYLHVHVLLINRAAETTIVLLVTNCTKNNMYIRNN